MGFYQNVFEITFSIRFYVNGQIDHTIIILYSGTPNLSSKNGPFVEENPSR